MNHKRTLEFFRQWREHFLEGRQVGMCTESVEDFHAGHQWIKPAEDFQFFPALYNAPARCVLGHEANNADRVGFVPDVIFQMVQNSTRFTHAGGSNNNVGIFSAVEGL